MSTFLAKVSSPQMDPINHLVRPTIVVSRCLGFQRCRYDGRLIYSELVCFLKPYVRYIYVCPEMSIGLGVPREPVKIIEKNNSYHMIQTTTGLDLTYKMNTFAEHFLGNLLHHGIDGFIFKSRSPSCGIHDTKIHMPYGDIYFGYGLFAKLAMEYFPKLPIEDELRLRNKFHCQRFLGRLFKRVINIV
ncbi:MAG: DUF523 domain-containing protein [Candidatus Magnetoovum sp. WYHC-5]|nr:DUF523 domain-containing protein [Candidatus Magnetoovum sp. WYHC-5]